MCVCLFPLVDYLEAVALLQLHTITSYARPFRLIRKMVEMDTVETSDLRLLWDVTLIEATIRMCL